MTQLKGSQILDRIRRKINDSDYNSYDEINEAQEWIADQSNATWLRESNTNAVALISGTRTYGLSHANIKAIHAIWIAGTSTTTAGAVKSITLTGTSVVSVETTIAHGASTDDKVTFANVGGTIELNGNTYTITKTDSTNFTLNGTNSSLFTAWTSGGDVSLFTTDSSDWSLMVETPAQLFEDKVKEGSSATTTNDSIVVTGSTTDTDTTRTDVQWYYYLSTTTDSAPFWQITITPIPSQSYKIRVDYTRLQTEVTPSNYPDIPFGYQKMLMNYAAYLILIRPDDKKNLQENQLREKLGMHYLKLANDDTLRLVMNSQANRTKNIDKRRQLWLK